MLELSEKFETSFVLFAAIIQVALAAPVSLVGSIYLRPQATAIR